MTKIEQLLSLLNDDSKRTPLWEKAQKQADGQSSCAYTASTYLQSIGIVKDIFSWAQELADAIEKDLNWIRITDPKKVIAGDVIVCEDLNENGSTDHIWIAVSSPLNDKQLTTKCADNHNGGKIYNRNLLSGSRTPMLYALRMPSE